jgi:hypothetical protein
VIEFNGINRWLLINHLNKRIPQNINYFYHVLIGLCTISHESLKIWFWKPVLQHCFIKLCPMICWSLVSSNCMSQIAMVVTLQIGRIVHMTNHSCPTINMLHVIKHDPTILQIPCRSCIHVIRLAPLPTPFIDILKMNTFCQAKTFEPTLLNEVIMTLRLQFKDAINIATL